jgi:hypothetical protein
MSDEALCFGAGTNRGYGDHIQQDRGNSLLKLSKQAVSVKVIIAMPHPGDTRCECEQGLLAINVGLSVIDDAHYAKYA